MNNTGITETEYIEDIQAFQKRKDREFNNFRNSDDYFTGYDYEEEPEEEC